MLNDISRVTKAQHMLPNNKMVKLCANDGCGKLLYRYQMEFTCYDNWNNYIYCDLQCSNESKRSKSLITNKRNKRYENKLHS